MRTGNHYLAMIASVALLHGISHADPAKADNTTGGSNGRIQSTGTSVKSPPQNVPAVGHVFSTSPVVTAKPAQNGLHGPAIPPSAIQPAGPLLSKAPAHGMAPAIVAGSATPQTKTTAAVTGTGLNRKP